jgi:hypothetical protein
MMPGTNRNNNKNNNILTYVESGVWSIKEDERNEQFSSTKEWAGMNEKVI